MVLVEKSTRRNLTELVVANGKIQPVVQVVINPEVSGEIIELPVKEGQHVKKGDLLLKTPHLGPGQLAQTETDLARCHIGPSPFKTDQWTVAVLGGELLVEDQRLFEKDAVLDVSCVSCNRPLFFKMGVERGGMNPYGCSKRTVFDHIDGLYREWF